MTYPATVDGRLLALILAAAILLTIAAPPAVAAGDGTVPDRDSASQISQTFSAVDSSDAAFDPDGGLESYLRWAALHSPSMRVAFYDWLAAIERTGYAGALPDPQFMYAYYIESVETRVGPQNHRLALKQSFPWFGTLGAQKDAAGHAADAAYRHFQSEELKLFYEVIAAYDEYYYAGREMEITTENLELMTYWESVARARYRVALAPHADVIKTQVELGRLEDRLLRLQSVLYPAAARLKAVLDLPDSLELPIPTEIVVVEDSLIRMHVLHTIMSDNPNLHARLALIEQARAGERVAAKRAWPSFTLGVDYIQTGPALDPTMKDSGKDPWIASAGISLPIWFGKNGARKREAAASRQRALYAYDELRNQLMDVAARVVFEHDDALRKIQLYRDGLIPKAEQSLNAAYTAYEAGEADFLNVLDAQRLLLDFQLMFERAQASLATRRAEIEMLMGQSLAEAEAEAQTEAEAEGAETE